MQFDDLKWPVVIASHPYNDVDSFREPISHGGGDRGTHKGLARYRKHFPLPADISSCRIFLEFEGMRHTGDIYLNGNHVGLYQNGITAYGIIDRLLPGVQGKVVAVKVDNRTNYLEPATGTAFEWNRNDFNPGFGGINQHVWLHVTGKIHQTLPGFYGLESQGVYVYAQSFDIAKKTAGRTVESEVQVAREIARPLNARLSSSTPRGRYERASRLTRSIWWMVKRVCRSHRDRSKMHASGVRMILTSMRFRRC